MKDKTCKIDPFWERASKLPNEEIDKLCTPKLAEAIKAHKKALENKVVKQK